MSTATTRHTLHLIRDHLGDLHAARHTEPTPVWPPQRLSTELWLQRDQEAAQERAEWTTDAIGDSPAPVLNLDALTAYEDITRELGELADVIAAECQTMPRSVPVPTSRLDVQEGWRVDPLDASDPRRWKFNRATTNAHWAAVYIDGRLAGDDLDDDLFHPIPDRLTREAGQTIRQCWRRMAAVLGIGDRTTTLPRPCPWCRNELALRQPAGEAPYVVCAGRWECTAPVRRDDRGRPLWLGGEMAHLHAAFQQRETSEAA